MLELEKFGVIEMTNDEKKEVEGGLFEWFLIGLFIGVVWAIGELIDP